MRWVLILMLFLMAGAAITVVFDASRGQSLGGTIANVAEAIILPGIFIGVQGLAWLMIPRSVRTMNERQSSLLSPTTWRWDDVGMTASSAAGDSIIRWQELHRRLIGSGRSSSCRRNACS